MKKNIIMTGLMAAGFSLILTGCGSSKASKEFKPALDTEKEVTINVVGGYDNFPSLDEVTADFTKYYPNVSISYEKIDDYSSVKDVLLTDNPDVDIFMANNTAVKNDETIMGIAVDLADPDLGYDLTQLDEGVLNSAKSGDSLLRLPIYSTASGLIVNKTLLEKEGLEIPENYDDFVSCCQALKEAGYTPIYGYDADGALGLSQGLYSGLVMTQMAKKNEDGKLQEDINSETAGAQEAYLDSLNEVSSFASLGFYSSEANAEISDSYEGAILRFFEGDVPFLAGSTETMSGTAKRESKSESFMANPFEYTFIAAPLGEKAGYVYVNSSEGLSINKNGANLEYAEEFLRFYCRTEELNKSADAKGMLSPASDTDSAASFPDLKMDNRDYVAYISDFYLESMPSQTINKIIELVGSEGESAEDALSQYDTIMEGYKAQQ